MGTEHLVGGLQGWLAVVGIKKRQDGEVPGDFKGTPINPTYINASIYILEPLTISGMVSLGNGKADTSLTVVFSVGLIAFSIIVAIFEFEYPK